MIEISKRDVVIVERFWFWCKECNILFANPYGFNSCAEVFTGRRLPEGRVKDHTEVKFCPYCGKDRGDIIYEK